MKNGRTLNVEVADGFNYLGTVFKYNGNYAFNNDFIIRKALKASNVLLYNCKRYPMKPNVLCQLFDAFVGSILSYSSEVWGYTKSKEIERVHLKFCKRILNIRINSCAIGVYGELARYPLYIQRYYRIIKYWCTLRQSNNIILNKLYDSGLVDCLLGHTNWVSNVKKLLDDYGFSNVFTAVNVMYYRLFLYCLNNVLLIVSCKSGKVM